MRKQVYDQPPRLADARPDRSFSPALEALVATALAKLPGQRFASAAAMRSALWAAADEPADSP